jgi:alkylhydroperoxidase family enzyme
MIDIKKFDKAEGLYQPRRVKKYVLIWCASGSVDVSAWWETPFFTEEERAVLKLAEQVTEISKGGITDDVYDHALNILGEQKIARAIFTIATINSWNRIAISMHMVAEVD